MQQPFGHDVASQTHSPLGSHSSPDLQAAHWRPAEPHDALVSLSRGSHDPLAVQQPLHEPPPHEHSPPEQVSPLPHEPHAAPPVPHWLPVWLA